MCIAYRSILDRAYTLIFKMSAYNKTTVIIGVVVVVVLVGAILWWMSKGGCGKGSTCGAPSNASVATANLDAATQAAAALAASQSIDAGATAVPQAPPSQPAPPAPAPKVASNTVTTQQISQAEAANINKNEVGDVQTLVMPMQTIDASGDHTLAEGNTHYILRGKQQRIVLPYGNDGNTLIMEDFVLTQQSGGPSVIVGSSGNPKATPMKVGQSYFVQITQHPGTRKTTYVLQKA